MLDSIFEKVSRGLPLGTSERLAFVLFLKRTQGFVDTVGNQTELDGSPRLMRPVITQPIWGSPPLSPFTASMQADMTVTSGATDQYVTLDSFYDRSETFSLDTTNQKIRVVNPSGVFMQFGGVVEWTANATGFRAAYMEAFTSADVSMGQGIMHSFPGWVGAENWQPFYFMFDPLNFGAMSYFKFRVYQNSGAGLVLRSAHIGLSLV